MEWDDVVLIQNYLQYQRALRGQQKRLAEIDSMAPPDDREAHESGEFVDYLRRREWEELGLACIQTDYLSKRAASLLLLLPDLEDSEMWGQVEFDIDEKEPHYLTSKGIIEVKKAIREETKHRREAVGYWFGIIVGVIGAVTGLVSALKG